MSLPVGPALARAEFDRLESAIVDPARAQGVGDVGEPASDMVARTSGAPEPPD